VAGGIDWFRWHHGTVTDQKFPLVAKRAGASVAEVIAVWACLLESASMNATERGCLDGAPDFEAMDCALGLPDGRARAIFQAMQTRDLVDEHLQVTAWPKRQPKREREDDSSTARVQAFRERQRQETPRNATERTETPRGEERREEEIPPSPPRGGGRFTEFWNSWPNTDRKADRKKCLEKWQRKGWDSEADSILSHVTAMKATRKWLDGFEPAPLTYLNGERWRDGVEAVGELDAMFRRGGG
jgi:hypothetical protein